MLSFGRKKKKEDWQTQGRAVATLKERANASLEVIICVAALLGIGTVMVYSATSVFADNSRYGVDALYFVMKHLQSIVVGVCAGWIVTKIPMSFWQRYALWVFFGALILLVCVLLPGVGKTVNGAKRWISLGVMNLQVSEIMKVAALIMAAWFAVMRQEYMHSFQKGFIPMAFAMVAIAALIIQQPDLGAMVVIVAEIMGVLFLGGLSFKIFTFVISVVVGFVFWMIIDTPWRLGRIFAYWDP